MKVTYVSDEGGDWEGYYIDGKVQDENHSISVRGIFENLAKHGLFELDSFRCDMTEYGDLPETPEGIPVERRIKGARCTKCWEYVEGYPDPFEGHDCA